MPDETVIDGEVVALDADGKPSFNLLQNYASSTMPLIFYKSRTLSAKCARWTRGPRAIRL